MAAFAFVDRVQVRGRKVITRDHEIGIRSSDCGVNRAYWSETAVKVGATNRGTHSESVARRAYRLNSAAQIRKSPGNSYGREPAVRACQENGRLQSCDLVGRQAKAST